MERVVLFYVLALTLATTSAAFNDATNELVCERVVEGLWGAKMYDRCVRESEPELQYLFCETVDEDVKKDCYLLEDGINPSALPAAIGEGSLPHDGDCVINDMPEKNMLCSKLTKALPKARRYLDLAEKSSSLCERIYNFCIASTYMAQTHDIFSTLLYEDETCKNLIYSKVDSSMKANKSSWGHQIACAFRYGSPNQYDEETTYIKTVSISSETINTLIQNLTYEAKTVNEKPLEKTKKTIPTTSTVPKEVETVSCESDSDCVSVALDCCGCTGGGKNQAVSKYWFDENRDEFEKGCEDTVCPSVMSQHISCYSLPVCVASKCSLQADTGLLCMDTTVKRNCEGQTPSKEAGTSQTHGISCNYINYLCGWGVKETETTTTVEETTTTTVEETTSLRQTTTSAKPTTTTRETVYIREKENQIPMEYGLMLGVLILLALAVVFRTHIMKLIVRENDGQALRGGHGLQDLRGEKSKSQDMPKTSGRSKLSDM